MDILYSRYSRKNKKTTESVIFRVYSKDIVKPIDRSIFLEYREYKMSIFGICFILYYRIDVVTYDFTKIDQETDEFNPSRQEVYVTDG